MTNDAPADDKAARLIADLVKGGKGSQVFAEDTARVTAQDGSIVRLEAQLLCMPEPDRT